MRLPANIVSIFFEQVKLHPEKVALIEKDKSITFQQLDDEVRIIASMYRQSGINKSDRVLFLIPTSADLYKHLLAVLYIGAVAVFPGSLLSSELVSCKALVGPWKFRAMSFLFPSLRKIPILLPILPGKKYEKVCDCIIEDSYEEDPAIIAIRVRNIGTPKIATRSHGSLKLLFEALSKRLSSQSANSSIPYPVLPLLRLGLGKQSTINEE